QQGQFDRRPAPSQQGQRPPYQQGGQGQRPSYQQGQSGFRPAGQQGQFDRRPASAQQGQSAAKKPAPPPRPKTPQQTTRREGVRVVDTRSSQVDLSKFDERFAEMAPERSRNIGGGKQRFKKNPAQRPAPFQKRETEAEKLRRLALEKARRAPLNITIPDEIVVSELATRLKKTNADVVKKLFLMGTIVTANDTIDYDTAALVAEEFGARYTREVVVTIEEQLIDVSADSEADLQPRSPVVVVMGHVDHGKTSLLDAIRNTHVTAGEAGGITQHIGAYKVEAADREITFLDTPGHAAFTSMRARGANVTDIAILVIAADDGIMPQTVEAINHAKAAGVAIIVAINKIDKPQADVERVKQELTEYELVPEEWGGDVICVPVSAVTHEGIDNLLDMVLLTADVKELRANPGRRGLGTVIEARLDKGRGAVATLLVQNGTLHTGDIIIAGTAVGRVRAMNDDKGQRIEDAGPSTPVEVIGLAEVPQAGDLFYAVEDEKMARELAEQRRNEERASQVKTTKVSLDDLFNQIQEGSVKELGLIVKADVQGSAEAVKTSLEKLSNDEVKVRVIHSGVGAITGSDLMLAEASRAIVIGFNVRPDAAIREDAAEKGVDIRTYRIIYECIEEMEAALKGMLAPKSREVIYGHAEVRATYKVSGVGTIGGCYVTNGKIVRGALARVLRDSVVIADTKIDSLKRFKDDAKEVQQGFECGVQLERFNDIKEGDVIEAYAVEEYRD
ncbi:MAG TPA: translation initiation factor IF-2, partial [Terriglobales bacterium]|nr:translation initiation factor IF-2 [Terriglobales bacterium]